jgi:hypothetical protein
MGRTARLIELVAADRKILAQRHTAAEEVPTVTVSGASSPAHVIKP